MHSVAALSFWNISFAAVIYAIIIYFIIKNKVDLESAKYPLYVYSLLVVLMAVKAVSMTYTSTHSLQSSMMFAAGALLFIVSDLFIGSYVYVDNKNMFKVLNSITYFSGQLLIASSLFYI